jgi:endoribonuclease Dicer
MDTRTIECNLDSIIRSPRHHRSELLFVHQPVFWHIMYSQPETPFSTNFASIFSIISALDIEEDPYIIDLRSQLKKAAYGSSDYHRIHQKLCRRSIHFHIKAFATF